MKIPELVQSDIILTNMQRAYAPEIADQAIGYLLAFTRSLAHFVRTQPNQEWCSSGPGLVLDELFGKTLLVIGLGGIGSAPSGRAAAFGMRVVATDPKVLERPLYVEELHKPAAFHTLLPRADVVAYAVLLHKGVEEDDRRQGVRHDETGSHRDQCFAGSGRRYRSPGFSLGHQTGRRRWARRDRSEPLPKGHALWSRNVIITPHSAGQSNGGERRKHEVLCENLRRFAAGEMLLNIVDKTVGY